jgi:hypothetical protein
MADTGGTEGPPPGFPNYNPADGQWYKDVPLTVNGVPGTEHVYQNGHSEFVPNPAPVTIVSSSPQPTTGAVQVRLQRLPQLLHQILLLLIHQTPRFLPHSMPASRKLNLKYFPLMLELHRKM